jgi:hypothetical protein
MQGISRRLCTGAVIITAAGIVIIGTAIMVGTIAITDGITVIMAGTGITTIIAAGFDEMHVPVRRLSQMSHRDLIKARCHDIGANARPA